MKIEQENLNIKQETLIPEHQETESIKDINIQDLANEKLALLDELEQEKNLTEEQIKQFEYLGGEENIDETTEEVEERISTIKQKIKTLLQKARKAIMILATVSNLGSQAEAMTNQAKNSDFGQNKINDINLGTINSINDPRIAKYEDFAESNLEPDPIKPIDPNKEPVLDGPEGEGYKEALKRMEENTKKGLYSNLKYSDLEGLSDSEKMMIFAGEEPNEFLYFAKYLYSIEGFDLPTAITKAAELSPVTFLSRISYFTNIEVSNLISLVNKINEKYPYAILTGNLNPSDFASLGYDYEELESNAIKNIKKHPEQINLLAEQGPENFTKYFREFKEVEGIGRYLIMLIERSEKFKMNDLTDELFSQNIDIIPDILSKIKKEQPLDYANNLKVFKKYLPNLDIEKEKKDVEKDVEHLKKLWEKGRIPWKDHWWFNKEVKKEILASIGNVGEKEVKEKMKLLNQVEIANILMPILKHVPILNKYIKDLARNYMDPLGDVSPQKFIDGKIDKDLDEKTKGRSLRDAFIYGEHEGFTPAPEGTILPTLPERLQKRNPHMNWFLGYGHGQEVPAEELSTERQNELNEVIKTGKPGKWSYDLEKHISGLEKMDNVGYYAERIQLGPGGKPYVVAFDVWDFGPEYGSWGFNSFEKQLTRAQGSALQKIPRVNKGEGQVGIIVNMPIVGYEEMLKE